MFLLLQGVDLLLALGHFALIRRPFLFYFIICKCPFVGTK